MFPKKSLALATSLFVALSVASPSLANSTPNAFSIVGTSWIDVPQNQRVYFEDFGQGQDDTNVFYVGSGITCTIQGVTATGPFLAGSSAGEPSAGECVDSNNQAYDPVDTGTRLGSHPLGFTINFFGTNYSSLYFSENGSVFFDNPSNRYNRSLTNLAVNAETSLISPFAVDLYYDDDESSMWTAQTTIDGKSAFVISWQELDECCETNTPDNTAASFQFVFINDGGGNFTAYFNYDKVIGINQGYDQAIFIDMKNSVTVGSNIVTADTVAGLTAGVCIEVNDGTVGRGSLTDSNWDDNANYIKLESAANKTVSVWTDSACTQPNNISVLQDISSGPEYVELEFAVSSYNSAAIGWGTYNSSTGATSTTEIFANQDIASLFNGGASKLISYSLNTAVPGRIVLGQVGGVTTGDPDVPPASSPIRDVPYYGPVGLLTDKSGLAGGLAKAYGLRLDTITRVSVGNQPSTFTLNPDGTLTFQIPELELGRHEVLFFVEVNNVNLVTSILIIGKANPLVPSATNKVNVGSFNGKLVVYAQNLDGARISWKVGGNWGSQVAVGNTLNRFDRLTPRSGVTLSVQVYVNGVLQLTKSVVTR
jgi:hypothetical protein